MLLVKILPRLGVRTGEIMLVIQVFDLPLFPLGGFSNVLEHKAFNITFRYLKKKIALCGSLEKIFIPTELKS